MNEPLIRPYDPEDLSACLGIFDSNLPRFFAPEERAQFCEFLKDFDVKGRSYFVFTRDDTVIACGGLLADEASGRASLEWGMVHRSLHRQGLGRQLTQARLDLARALPQIVEVTIDTSQHSRRFYERFGFKVTKIKPDEFGPGLDCWHMAVRL